MEQFAQRHVKCAGMFSSPVIALALIALLTVLWAFAQPVTAHAASLTASGFDGAGAVQVGTQGDYEYMDADNKIEVYQKTDGRYSYNADTKTIKLFSLKATDLNINVEGEGFILELHGESSLEHLNSSSDITVLGSGSIAVGLKFKVMEPCGLTMQEGTIDGTISCGWLNAVQQGRAEERSVCVQGVPDVEGPS